MRYSAQLIEQVVESARGQGLSAADLAAKAGIRPASLSRARRTGRYNADTLERLLAAVGAEVRLSLRPRAPSRTLPLALRKLNAGRREKLSAEELRRLLTKFRPSSLAARAYSHLVGVIEELPLEQLHDLVIEGDATLPALRRIAAYVEGEGETVDWINERDLLVSGDLADAARLGTAGAGQPPA